MLEKIDSLCSKWPLMLTPSAQRALESPFPRRLPEFGNQGSGIRSDAIFGIEEPMRRIKNPLHRWQYVERLCFRQMLAGSSEHIIYTPG
jgi:hypothetical protein